MRSCVLACLTLAFVFQTAEHSSGQQRDLQSRRNRSQSQTRTTQDWQYRFELFQMLLEQNGLQPVTVEEAQAELRDPNSSLVVVSLGMQREVSFLSRLRDFANNGKVLIATDSEINFEGLFQIRRNAVQALESKDSYQGFADCVIVNDFPADDPLLGKAKQLIINRGGWISRLTSRYGAWEIHARYPRQVLPPNSQNSPLLASMTLRDRKEPSIYVSADHSLLSNGMIWHGDNAMLAIQLSYVLAEGNNKMLFMVDGVAIDSYTETTPQEADNTDIPPIPPLDDLPLDSLPEPTMQQALQVLNQVVSKAEDSDILNEVLANQPRRILEPYYRRILLILGVAILLVYAIYRLSKPPSIATNPSTTLAVGPPPVDTSQDFATAEQRGVAARFIARDFFIEQTGSTDSRKWRESFLQGSGEHQVGKSKSGKLKKPLKESDRISYLIAIADASHPPLFSPQELTEFGVAIESLRSSAMGNA